LSGIRCGATKGLEVHHKNMDAMEIDKSRELTADDGLLLCIPCHKEVTKAQAPVLAKAKRREAKHLGAHRAKQPIPKGHSSLKGPPRKHEGRPELPPRRLYV
jgi:hypothetical protein